MTELFAPPDVQTQLATFSPTDAAIADLAEEYMPLAIAGLDDLAGYAKVHRARMDIRSKRCAVEKVRKELKADSLNYGRRVDAEAKRLAALLEPIETHLLTQEKAIDDEKDRIKNAARLKAEAEARAKAEAEEAEWKAAQEAEAAALRAAQERINAERRALEAERARIDAEKRVLEIEKAKAEATEKARIVTEARITRETAEKAAREKAHAEAEEAARVRAEALRPDRDKLLAVAKAVAAIKVPKVTEIARQEYRQVVRILVNSEINIRHIVEAME